MTIEHFYKHDINRPLNPAVSVTDNNAQTVRVEIEEYVFTDEILNYLYKVMNDVRNRKYDHCGIWISGYYGSGKSHFLKYLNFCLTKQHRDQALERMIESVKDEFDPLLNPKSKLEPTLADFMDLADWIKKAEIDTILFNIGDKIGNNTDNKTTFAKALWEEFNGLRGFNKFNISLAQYLEKPLKEKGKYDEFKEAIAEDGFDWEKDAESLAITELDYVMEKAAQVADFSIDVMRPKIAKDSLDATPERLSEELKRYVEFKGDNYRLIFFIDEVSQFIGSRQQLLLQLQQIVTTIAKDCNKKVWVGCTAQQDLSEVLDTCSITSTSDQYGKILGRFQTRVPLQGTNTEYITQKRILEKNEDGLSELGKFYDANRPAIESQFNLPTGYRKYASKNDFINFYPFVPYQFQLIMNVFDAFVKLAYIDTESKGNERSVLKITHKTAQIHRNEQIGSLISFDMLYTTMFEAGLKNEGQKAIRNANSVIVSYEDKAFGQRVVNLLFMLCNISDNNKLLFPATLDNIVTLMMTEVDQNKLELKERIVKALNYLEKSSIVRTQRRDGKAEVYCFLSEEESEVNQLINSQSPNNNAISDSLKGILGKYITFNNKVTFNGSTFNLGISINDRYIIGGPNAPLLVEFRTEAASQPNIEAFILQNEPKKLVYYIVEEYKSNSKLRNDFFWYCKVQVYLNAYASNSSDQRSKTNDVFRARAAELLKESIYPEFCKLLDTCPVISGNSRLDDSILASKKGNERYKVALEQHYVGVYPMAGYVVNEVVPKDYSSLRSSILRPIQSGEYGPLNPLTRPEQEIEDYLNRCASEKVLGDVVDNFNKPPYGWSEIATTYFVNELVRRQKRAYSYKGNPHLQKSFIAENILKDRNSFTITSSNQISPILVQDFTIAWREIFNEYSKDFPTDSLELFNYCHDDDANSNLRKIVAEYPKIVADLRLHHVDSLSNKLESTVHKVQNDWLSERDPQVFFQRIVSEKEVGKAMMDRCKNIIQFARGPQMNAFSEFYNYADSNKENFAFIKDDEGKQLVTDLQQIFTETDPINDLPKYKKRVEVLKVKLAQIKNELEEKIRTSYAETLDELASYAASVGVSFDKTQYQSSIDAKCSTTNLYALQSHANTDEFRKNCLAWINARIPSKPTTDTQPDNGVPPSKPKPKKIAYLSPKDLCKARRITEISEIESYISAIREKLTLELNQNDEIIVS